MWLNTSLNVSRLFVCRVDWNFNSIKSQNSNNNENGILNFLFVFKVTKKVWFWKQKNFFHFLFINSIVKKGSFQFWLKDCQKTKWWLFKWNLRIDWLAQIEVSVNEIKNLIFGSLWINQDFHFKKTLKIYLAK